MIWIMVNQKALQSLGRPTKKVRTHSTLTCLAAFLGFVQEWDIEDAHGCAIEENFPCSKAHRRCEHSSRQNKSFLNQLPRALLAKMWPSENLISGSQVCKWLRRDLCLYAPTFVLRERKDEQVTPETLHKSLSRLQRSNLHLTWQSKSKFSTLHTAFTTMPSSSASILLSLVQLDVSTVGITEDMASQLASILTKSPNLARLR